MSTVALQAWHLPRCVVSFPLPRGSQELELSGDPGPPLWRQCTLEASDRLWRWDPGGRAREGEPRSTRQEPLQQWRPYPAWCTYLHKTGRHKFFMAIFYTEVFISHKLYWLKGSWIQRIWCCIYESCKALNEWTFFLLSTAPSFPLFSVYATI